MFPIESGINKEVWVTRWQGHITRGIISDFRQPEQLISSEHVHFIFTKRQVQKVQQAQVVWHNNLSSRDKLAIAQETFDWKLNAYILIVSILSRSCNQLELKNFEKTNNFTDLRTILISPVPGYPTPHSRWCCGLTDISPFMQIQKSLSYTITLQSPNWNYFYSWVFETGSGMILTQSWCQKEPERDTGGGPGLGLGVTGHHQPDWRN